MYCVFGEWRDCGVFGEWMFGCYEFFLFVVVM